MPRTPTFHEDYSRDQDVKAGSERSLGLVFAVVFAIIALWPLLDGVGPRWWAVGAAGVFLGLGLFAPPLLKPLNRAWFRLGMVLHKVVNPIIMALLFFVTVTPMALLMRVFGKDLLHIKFDAAAKTYWVERTPPGPEPDTMRHQF